MDTVTALDLSRQLALATLLLMLAVRRDGRAGLTRPLHLYAWICKNRI